MPVGMARGSSRAAAATSAHFSDDTLVGTDMADFDQIAVEHFCEYLRIKTVQPNPDYASCMKFLEKVSRFQREGHHINLIFVDGCWTESEMVYL